MIEDVVLCTAAVLAGALNAVAGGGTFLTFPAPVYAGLPVIPANATSAIAVFPDYLGGALGFRRDLAAVERKHLLQMLGPSVLSGLTGSLLLLITPSSVFRAAVPWLLLLATIIVAAGEKITAWVRDRTGRPPVSFSPGLLAISVYGGYFNGGLGIMLMALFTGAGMRDMNTMNGLKSGVSFMLAAISLATYATAGLIAWPAAVLMMMGSTVGGYFGARVARAMPRGAIRAVLIAVGLGMSTLFFIRD